MRVLIVTQVVDTEHPILVFFHRWLEEFAKHCEQVTVICLQEGAHALPDNVKVYSLGKEVGKSRLTYLIRFYKLIISLRHEHDSVFVHMNQIYVLLGAPLWRLWRKRVGLWYMHGTVTWSLRLAEKLVDVIFTGSPESFRLPSKKVVVTGHGIDTGRFAPQTGPKDLDLITVGRITESKNLIALIDILREVRQEHEVTLSIVGGALTEGERAYEAKLRSHIEQYDLEHAVQFLGRIPQAGLPETLARAKVFVTAAQNGSLDKAVLEAMACGLPVVSMAPGTESLPLGLAQVKDVSGMVQMIKKVISEKTPFHQNDYVNFVSSKHSLSTLIPKILHE